MTIEIKNDVTFHHHLLTLVESLNFILKFHVYKFKNGVDQFHLSFLVSRFQVH